MKALIVAALVACGLALAACGGSTLKLSSDPQLRKAEQTIQSCVGKSDMLTKSGREKFVTCVAPPGKKVQVESCIRSTIAHGSYFTKNERNAVIVKAANCLVTK